MRANREIYVLLTGRISLADCSSRSVVVLISYDLGKLPDEGLYRVTAILNEKNRKKRETGEKTKKKRSRNQQQDEGKKKKRESSSGQGSNI